MSTGGEGGMLLTSKEDVRKRAWSYKDHGKSWDKVWRENHPLGFRWLHDSLGTNWRMTEMQAAIGRCQLLKLDNWLAIRRRNADWLSDGLEPVSGLRVVRPSAGVTHAFYRYYFFVRPGALRTGWGRDRILAEIADRGGPCYTGSCPEIYNEKVFDYMDCRPQEALPVAHRIGQTSLALLVDPSRDAGQIEQAVDAVSTVMARAVRRAICSGKTKD